MFSNSIKQTNEKIVARDVIINKLSFVSVKADINWERGISLCKKYYECLKSNKIEKVRKKEEKKMKSKNYRYELEELQNEKFFLVHARVSRKGLKTVDNMFGGYKLRTCCLDNVQCGICKNGRVIKKITTDHVWVDEELCTVARDKNIEEGDVVIFKARTIEYLYSHGHKQIGITQYEPAHRNISKDYIIDYTKKAKKTK